MTNTDRLGRPRCADQRPDPSRGSAEGQAEPKPVTKTYTADAPLPSPVNFQTGVCHADVPQSADDEVFKALFAGRLSAKLTGFVGDGDFAFQQDGANAAERAGRGRRPR